jgi:predicted AAA+ superfamily ATPase
MNRDFKRTLLRWKTSATRMPLIFRGARQVGKTYIIQAFGQKEFQNVVTIDFEASPIYMPCFETMQPITIISQIEAISKIRIIPGYTLLFLDEIQNCPKALQSLRYFKEQLPQLHVIAAGSLLEFALHEHNFSFPVGRIQFAKLYPLSFEEFLEANNDTILKEQLASFTLESPPPTAIHQHLISKINEYFIIGGMPSPIVTFLKTKSLLEVKYVQKALLDSFEADFGKYAKQIQHKNLKKIFSEAPRLLGSHVKYSRIDPELPNPSREMKHALELLKLAGLVYFISATSAGDIPLLAGLKDSIFKLIFLDIGLVEQSLNIEPYNTGLMTGPLAEQFVGQELLATSDPMLDTKMFFWTRPNGSAEVDYLLEHNGTIYPIEVKPGKTGTLKSLQIFMEEKQSPIGIKISQDNLHFSKNNKILSVPFYLTSHLKRLIKDFV